MSSYEHILKSTKLFNALIDTASDGKISRIEKCLDEGANINEQFFNYFNNTPLHISVMKEDLDVVNLLLKRGAKTNYRNQNGMTALDVAKAMDSDVRQVIIELLHTHESKTQMNPSEVNKSLIEMNHKRECKYQKQFSTSGIKGQLYETKFITLIRIRAFMNDYDQFYLGTSLEGIGALDDICVRYKQNNKDVIVFLQAKQRTEVTKSKVTVNDLWKPTGDFSLFKYFDSYVKIRERFNNTKKGDVMFNGKYEDLKCYLVITCPSASNELKDKFKIKRNSTESLTDKDVRNLIRIGESSDIFQYQHTDGEVDLLIKPMLLEEMKCLGKGMIDFIMNNCHYVMILNDHYILKYHVVLAQYVINVSDVNNAGHRTGTFRDDFFNNNDELLVALKEILFYEAVKRTKLNKGNLEELVKAFVLEPTVVTVSKLMQSVSICYDYQMNTLAITNKTAKGFADVLSEVKIEYNVYKEAYNIAIKEKLNSLCFKLPTTFGNIDIAVSCDKKGGRRLEYLAGKLEKVMSHFKDKNVSINDEFKMMHFGIMGLNGGLGSAVGNLLISSEEDMSLKFNVNNETLGQNATMLLKLLRNKISDLDTYRLRLDVEGLPKLSLKASARDKLLAKDFLNNLWFYINQAKENEIESHSKKILENYCITNRYDSERTATSIRTDAMYLKIHDEIQKWWMHKGKSYYLTNDSESFELILKEDNSVLITLSRVYIKRMNSYVIGFNIDSVKSLCTQFGEFGEFGFADNIIVLTEVIALTGIKLVQHFQTFNDYAFIELNSPLLSFMYHRGVLIDEINNKELQTIILICEDLSESKSELLRYIIKETAMKKLIIVTNMNSYEKLHSYINNNRMFIKLADDRIEFNDLFLTSQRKVLSSKLMFQDIETTFKTITQEDAEYLITPYILQKVITNDKIVIGKTISNPNYEEIKYYYLDRKLKEIEKESSTELFSQSVSKQLKAFNKLKTFEVINDTVVLIGAPGSGKSTFLTHMSVKTKQQNPKIWIVRINLLDYTQEFHRWQKNKVKIDLIEALKFICKSAMSQITSKIKNNFDEIIFNLEIVNGELMLRKYDFLITKVYFELQMFIYCYNKGNMVLLFDGFDEICPNYKHEIIELLKCLVTKSLKVNSFDKSSHKQCIWIASRSYNNIVMTLQTEFGTLYDLEELTLKELKMSMKEYFKINLNLNELNYDQFINIDGFLEYMKENKMLCLDKIKIRVKYYNFLLHELYFTAVEYFLSETKYIDFTPEKYSLVEKWQSRISGKYKVPLISDERIIKIRYNNKLRRKRAMHLRITPLHLYVALQYFTNKIKNNITLTNNINVLKWDLEMNTLTFYKHFLEIQLKTRCIQQKNEDLYNPDLKLIYEKELKVSLDKHEKIAFYATYFGELEDILTQVEIDEMRQIIKEFEAGVEKTGVVDNIINGVPKFIHLTFQEYLTAEYVIHLFKKKPEEKTKLLSFIIKSANIFVLEFIGLKLKCEKEIKNIFKCDNILPFFDAVIEENEHSLQSMHFGATLLESSEKPSIFKWIGFIVPIILLIIYLSFFYFFN